MKRFLCLLAASLMLVGCGAASDNNTNGEDTELTTAEVDYTVKTAKKIRHPEKVFTDGDFAFYGENGVSIVKLGQDEETASRRLETIGKSIGEFTVNYEKKINVESTENQDPANYVRYISYVGYHNPVYTSKGIYTTGTEGTQENCSEGEDVIKAYDIDTKNESYLESEGDENNYCIALYYDKNGDRIISPSGTDLRTVDAAYKVRFLINGGIVRQIDFYQIDWA